VLSPGERLILVGFDPVLDADAAALFRALRRPPETVTLVGPWHGSGAADTTGTALRLLPPKASGGFDDSEVPPVGSESFAPAPTAPWPADGFLPGYALARRRPTEIADDPTHWVATMAAPGWADGDFDGLPDAWEVAHGLDPLQSAGIHGAAGDPDADGRSNATEYRGDGDPRAADAGSRVRALALARGRVVCLVAAEPGRTLTWEALDPDGRNGWERVQTQVVPAEGLAVLTVDARPGTARLVRVREP